MNADGHILIVDDVIPDAETLGLTIAADGVVGKVVRPSAYTCRAGIERPQPRPEESC